MPEEQGASRCGLNGPKSHRTPQTSVGIVVAGILWQTTVVMNALSKISRIPPPRFRASGYGALFVPMMPVRTSETCARAAQHSLTPGPMTMATHLNRHSVSWHKAIEITAAAYNTTISLSSFCHPLDFLDLPDYERALSPISGSSLIYHDFEHP